MEKDLIAVWRPIRSLEKIKEGIAKLESLGGSTQHAVPYTCLKTLSAAFPALNFGLSGMNDIGATSFTKSIATKLLQDIGAKFVLLGTAKSQKSSTYDPTTLPQQIQEISSAQIIPRLCIGESFKEYSEQRSQEVLTKQLENISEQNNLELIYEAPWIDESPFTPALEEILKAYEQCRTTLQSLNPSLSKLKLFCKIPQEWLQLKEFPNPPVDGFYVNC